MPLQHVNQISTLLLQSLNLFYMYYQRIYYQALSRLDTFFLIPCTFTVAKSIVKAHEIKKNLSNLERVLILFRL